MQDSSETGLPHIQQARGSFALVGMSRSVGERISALKKPVVNKKVQREGTVVCPLANISRERTWRWGGIDGNGASRAVCRTADRSTSAESDYVRKILETSNRRHKFLYQIAMLADREQEDYAIAPCWALGPEFG